MFNFACSPTHSKTLGRLKGSGKNGSRYYNHQGVYCVHTFSLLSDSTLRMCLPYNSWEWRKEGKQGVFVCEPWWISVWTVSEIKVIKKRRYSHYSHYLCYLTSFFCLINLPKIYLQDVKINQMRKFEGKNEINLIVLKINYKL
jgi:hypothetical protein